MKHRKTKIFWLIAVSMIAIVFFSVVRATTTDIIINEIGAFEPNNHEWIEIFNRGGGSIDLLGWKFFESGVNHGLSLFQGEDLILESGEYAIIAQNADNFITDYPDFSGTVIDSAWSVLSADGELIELRVSNDASSTIESFVYLTSQDSSLERKDPWLDDYTSLNWQSHSVSSTPGGINSNFILSSSTPPLATTTLPLATTTPPLATSTPPLATTTPPLATTTPPCLPCICPAIVCPTADSSCAVVSQSNITPEVFLKVTINEFMANPLTGDKEWIELYNDNEVSVNLDSWQIFDGVGKIMELSGAISPHNFLVFELSSAKLNNSGDMIILKHKNGEISDSVSYGNWDDGNIENNALISEKGGSVARKVDGLDLDDDENDFALSLVPTKNQPNLVVFFDEMEEIEEFDDLDDLSLVNVEIEENKDNADNIEVKKTTAVTDGKTVIQGIVSVVPGILGAQIFYITNPCLQIYSFKKAFPDLSVGDEIMATGALSESNGERRLKTSIKEDIRILTKNGSIDPEEISSDEIEQYPGCLVKVSGDVIEKKSNTVYLDDGFGEIEVFAKSGANIKTSEFKEGNWLSVTGIVSVASGKIRILPRSQEDLVLGAVKGETVSSTPLVVDASTATKSPIVKYWWLLGLFALGAVGAFVWKKYQKKDQAN